MFGCWILTTCLPLAALSVCVKATVLRAAAESLLVVVPRPGEQQTGIAILYADVWNTFDGGQISAQVQGAMHYLDEAGIPISGLNIWTQVVKNNKPRSKTKYAAQYRWGTFLDARNAGVGFLELGTIANMLLSYFAPNVPSQNVNLRKLEAVNPLLKGVDMHPSNVRIDTLPTIPVNEFSIWSREGSVSDDQQGKNDVLVDGEQGIRIVLPQYYNEFDLLGIWNPMAVDTRIFSQQALLHNWLQQHSEKSILAYLPRLCYRPSQILLRRQVPPGLDTSGIHGMNIESLKFAVDGSVVAQSLALDITVIPGDMRLDNGDEVPEMDEATLRMITRGVESYYLYIANNLDAESSSADAVVQRLFANPFEQAAYSLS